MTRLTHFAALLGFLGAATVVAGACSNTDGARHEQLGKSVAALDTGLDGGPTTALINEIERNPPGGDTNHKYIELRGTPGATLTGFYLVVFEGDSGAGGGGAGRADIVINLGTACGGAATPCRFGSNGLLVITETAGTHTFPAATTVVRDGGISALEETGTITFALIFSPTTAITEGMDYDTQATPANVLNGLPATATIVDSIAFSDGGATDETYGGAVISATPDAAVRFSNDDAESSAGAWYYGALSGAAATTAFDATGRSANFPTGGALTPGAPNVGTKSTDAGVDAADAADTAIADTAVADTNLDTAPVDTGVAPTDTGTAPTDTGTAPTDTGTAPTDTGAAPTDTGAAPTDTGTVDLDTGTAADTGSATTDTGASVADTGEEIITATDDDSGCGCVTPRSTSSSSAAFAALVLGLAVALRRRR